MAIPWQTLDLVQNFDDKIYFHLSSSEKVKENNGITIKTENTVGRCLYVQFGTTDFIVYFVALISKLNCPNVILIAQKKEFDTLI